MGIGAIAFGFTTLFLAEYAVAQTTQPLPPLLPPLLTDPSLGPVRQQAPEPLQPVTYPPEPNVDGDYVPPATQPTSFVREGTYFLHQSGRFGRGGTDGQQWIFTPDAPANSPPNAPPPSPLVVLANRNRASMEAEVKPPATEARFAVNGLVTYCYLQNYLLVDIAAPVGAETTQPVLAAQKAAPTTRRISSTMPANEVLDQMLKPAADAPARPLRPAGADAAPNDSTSGAAAIAPGAAQLTVLREGTFLVDRTGRLTRSADGQTYEFTFESDGRAMKDPPVIILPNLKLMTMEQAVKSANRDLRFRITGMVTEYNGRNYVLLEKVVVPPETTQQF